MATVLRVRLLVLWGLWTLQNTITGHGGGLLRVLRGPVRARGRGVIGHRASLATVASRLALLPRKSQGEVYVAAAWILSVFLRE